MTISATTQGLRPGVCTSTSRPSVPFDGQVIYETDTNRVLVWDNSAWVMIADTDSPPGLQLIKSETSVTATNGSPKGVESVFTSEFRNYRLVWRATQATTCDFNIQLYSGTNTAETGSVYNYGYGGNYVGSGPTYNWGAFSQTNPFSPSTAMYLKAIGNTYTGSGIVDIFNPQFSTITTWLIQSYADYTGTYYNAAISGGGHVSTSTVYTGFRFIPSAGTSTITYRLYGYRD